MTNLSGAGYRTERSEHLSSCCDAPPKSTVIVHHERNINRTGFRKPTPISDDGIGICSACGEWTEFNEVEVDDD
jgi:hypothetical protein